MHILSSLCFSNQELTSISGSEREVVTGRMERPGTQPFEGDNEISGFTRVDDMDGLIREKSITKYSHIPSNEKS